MILHDALDRALARAAADEAALLDARVRWRELAGEIFDDEPLYEERTTAFLEWFLIDYRGTPEAPTRPPIAHAIAVEPDEAARAALTAVATSHRSLFTVREHLPDGVALEDVWGGATFHVHERRRLDGMAPGELFEARLVAEVGHAPGLAFTRTFCFHPREALDAVREHVARARRAGEAKDAFLFRLLRLRVRCERYRHVSPVRIYAQDETRG